ncbi:MAG TPA: bifunctional YncE family protein/alkaline phosphatase family protein [Chitinophagaceae bacterium]|nr:bifunctional YncE family protein/alkaline phosphatase family protein [Chitinophagaceae bacterium]
MRILPCLLLIAATQGPGNQVTAQQSFTGEQKILNHRRIMLPDGWSLSPAGFTIPLKEDLPLNMAVSPGGKYLAVTNNGDGNQSITLIDPNQRRVLDDKIIGKAWFGLKFSRNGKSLYVSGGNDNIIIHYRIIHDRLVNTDTIKLGNPWPVKISPAGLDLDEQRHRLYVVTRENRSLYIVDLRTRKVIHRVLLGNEAYTCVLSPDKKWLYISLWGGAKVAVYDVSSGVIKAEIPVGSHPNDLALSDNGRFLFVANANDNSVSVIRTTDNRVIETLIATLYPHSPPGSTTNSLALSPDQKTLYVANADNNCLAVFDVSHPGNSHSRGFIPVGWYPTCVRVSGNHIYAANGRGMTSMANPGGPDPLTPGHPAIGGKNIAVQYIGSLFKGTISVVAVPDGPSLQAFTEAVFRNTPYSPGKEALAPGLQGNPIPRQVGAFSPIKHVFYIIRENRTYDQVFGDIKEGNGDSSLCLFGEKVTPNAHGIVRDFVLLDNFYVDATVSADGHNWSMGAYATDYVNKVWPTQYSGRGGIYDFEGIRKLARPDGGYIWAHCQKAGISFRDYGEFFQKGYMGKLALRGHYCTTYPGWDLSIQDVYREKIWQHDFDSLVSIHAVPVLNTIYLPQDHTSGLERGAYTPIAHVADNDLALGRLVDHISHSPVWTSSVIFVLEDDAQDGPDHVDAHRSPALIISPFVKRHYVDHTMYSTTGLLRTIELIIGMKPMSQYDAAATPMYRSFTGTPDLTPFNSLPAKVDINNRNPGINLGATESAGLDLSRADAVPDAEMNAMIWESVKGPYIPMPPPHRSAFVQVTGQ